MKFAVWAEQRCGCGSDLVDLAQSAPPVDAMSYLGKRSKVLEMSQQYIAVPERLRIARAAGELLQTASSAFSHSRQHQPLHHIAALSTPERSVGW